MKPYTITQTDGYRRNSRGLRFVVKIKKSVKRGILFKAQRTFFLPCLNAAATLPEATTMVEAEAGRWAKKKFETMRP